VLFSGYGFVFIKSCRDGSLSAARHRTSRSDKCFAPLRSDPLATPGVGVDI
jgi:hypothetical protein